MVEPAVLTQDGVKLVPLEQYEELRSQMQQLQADVSYEQDAQRPAHSSSQESFAPTSGTAPRVDTSTADRLYQSVPVLDDLSPSRFDTWIDDIKAVFGLLPVHSGAGERDIIENRKKSYLRFRIAPKFRKSLRQLPETATAEEILVFLELCVRPNQRKEMFGLMERLMSFKQRQGEPMDTAISCLEDMCAECNNKGVNLPDLMWQFFLVRS